MDGKKKLGGRRCLPPVEMFWSKVERIPLVDCWLWTGQRQISAHAGHGKLSIDMKDHYVHRYSWELHRGKIPDGMAVLHKCDVEICVNPDHLFLGTLSDNIFDMWDKGRARPSGNSKLRVCVRGSRSTV